MSEKSTAKISEIRGFPQDPIPSRPIRVTIPAKVAYNIDALQKVLVNVAEAIGCRPCFSGADCLFQISRDYVVDPANLNVREKFEQ
jgi:hypothetical protein